jgi:Undecaprenyl-phosphate galactose phosphotransferase WbaP
MAVVHQTSPVPHGGHALRGPAFAGRLERLWASVRPSRRTGILLVLLAADALAAQIAFHLGSLIGELAVRRSLASWTLDPHLSIAALTLPLGYYLLDVYRIHGQAPVERFPARIKAMLIVFLALLGWQHETGRWLWPAGAGPVILVLAAALPIWTERLVRSVLIRLGHWELPVVVIGAGRTGQQVVDVLRRRPELGLRPVGLFDGGWAVADGAPAADEVPGPGVPVLGSIASSAAYAQQVETAIVTTPLEPHRSVDAVAMQLPFRDVIVVPELHELQTLGVRTRDLDGLIGLQMRRNLLLRRNRLLKQATDQLVALPLLVICAPLIAVLALWIMAVSDGSPFYGQTRIGKDGRKITIWKLRTMYADAEALLERHLASDAAARQEWSRYFKLRNDPRILPGVGWFLRRTSLDELPQIYNVARGEMSLVGPRPFPQYHLDMFDSAFQALRASVMPGITGLWQVSARSDGDLKAQQELDTYYIKNWSIWIDLYILSQTLGAVISGRGAR